MVWRSMLGVFERDEAGEENGERKRSLGIRPLF